MKNVDYLSRIQELKEIRDYDIFIRKAIECWELYNNGWEERIPVKYSETTGEPVEWKAELSDAFNKDWTVIIHPDFTTDFDGIHDCVREHIRELMFSGKYEWITHKGSHYVVKPAKEPFDGSTILAGIKVIRVKDWFLDLAGRFN